MGMLMGRHALVWGGALMFLLLGACPGDAPSRHLGDQGGASERGVSDGAVQDATIPCTATGAAANCNPIELTGCSAGAACYLVKDVITGCVCPVGEVAEGGDCSKTYECAPGLVCAGTSAPGKCTKICDVSDDQCPQGTYCLEITGFKGYGYCKAK